MPEGFEKSASTGAPQYVRYKSVPGWAKFPQGPFRQAPAEHGGEWWFVNPFTGNQPWLRAAAFEAAQQNPPEASFPEGFVEIFGPRPTRQEFPDYHDHLAAKVKWEQDLQQFQQAGTPPDVEPAALAAATQEFQQWGLGEPRFYEGRHGWRVRFPDSQLPSFEAKPATAMLSPHLIISKYHQQLLKRGIMPEVVHPWVPPHLLSPDPGPTLT